MRLARAMRTGAYGQGSRREKEPPMKSARRSPLLSPCRRSRRSNACRPEDHVSRHAGEPAAAAVSAEQLAARNAELDRTEAALRRALRKKPPALPKLPARQTPAAHPERGLIAVVEPGRRWGGSAAGARAGERRGRRARVRARRRRDRVAATSTTSRGSTPSRSASSSSSSPGRPSAPGRGLHSAGSRWIVASSRCRPGRHRCIARASASGVL